MDDRWFSLLDMAIVGVPAIAFGVWQLASINREIARDKKSPEDARHPVGEHRLDDR